MGWTKHLDAVNACRLARSRSHADIGKLAAVLRRELKCPSDTSGEEIYASACDLHSELRRFSRLRHAVGGQENVSLTEFIDLLLAVFRAFQWSEHVRKTV